MQQLQRKHRHIRGFSLLELSIVLVIIGLIVGGIMVGKDIMAKAELNAVIAEEGQILQAMKNFQSKYNQLPGDFSNATTLWGVRSSVNCATTASTDRLTCDGNGDGQIEFRPRNSGGTIDADSNEAFRFWQHLSNADLFPGQYTGMGASSGLYEASDTGVNVPEAAFKGAGWTALDLGEQDGSVAILFEGAYGNVLALGKDNAAGTYTNTVAFTSSQAHFIDKKLDDGFPGRGDVLAFKYSTSVTPCVTSNNILTAEYHELYGTRLTCALIFKTKM